MRKHFFELIANLIVFFLSMALGFWFDLYQSFISFESLIFGLLLSGWCNILEPIFGLAWCYIKYIYAKIFI